MTLGLLAVVALPSAAQTKSETKLYAKTVKARTVKAYDKFLGKYPSSVYASDIQARKDTILCISPYSPEMAHEILKPFLPQGATFVATGSRIDAVDRIHGLCVAAEGMAWGEYRNLTIIDKGGIWEMENDNITENTIDDDREYTLSAVRGPEKDGIRGGSFFNIGLLYNASDGSSKQILREFAYLPEEQSVYDLAFSGKSVKAAEDTCSYRIEGRANDAIASGMDQPAMRWLLARMKSDKGLVFLSDGDYLTDYAIEKWLEANPEALSKSGSLKFSVLPEECSLVQIHQGKKKVNSSKYQASMFDYRGYTVIISYCKENGEYHLAWVEPECKNHYRDRLLNAIVFEGATQLEMQYYHGSRFYKRHLGLASKAIK